MPQLSFGHLLLIFLVVLIIFGPKSLPKIGQALGKGIRDFKDAAKGLTTETEEEEKEKPRPPVAQTIARDATVINSDDLPHNTPKNTEV